MTQPYNYVDKELVIARQKGLIDYPGPRLPICLLIDVSYSMGEVLSGAGAPTGQTVERDGGVYNVVEVSDDTVTRMDEANVGISQFFRELLGDDDLRHEAEVAVVSFAETVSIVQDFQPLDLSMTDIALEVTDSDDTLLGRGLRAGLELLNIRKKEYKSKSVDYWQPWLVVLTDGKPTDDPKQDDHYEIVGREVKNQALDGKLVVFPVAVGPAGDMKALQKIAGKHGPWQLKDHKFREFFAWLRRSSKAVSQSMPGEEFKLNEDEIKAWSSTLE